MSHVIVFSLITPSVAIPISTHKMCKSRKNPSYNRNGANDPRAVAHFKMWLDQAPVIVDGVEPTSHVHVLHEHISKSAACAFPKHAPAPKN
eukprot:1739694-Karenia_brevis.AAC.1